MSPDGHSGIENEQVNQGGSGNFILILSALKQSGGEIYLVIHASSSTSYSFGYTPAQFLEEIGFTRSAGQCRFVNN